jgi:hypothetical protein
MGKTIIIEGRYDSATNKVVKDIMTAIKRSIDYPINEVSKYTLPHDLEGTDEYEMDKAGISFSAEITIIRTNSVPKFQLKSFMYQEEDVMEFNLLINPENEQNVYEEIYMKLQEDVRHEMEHLLQDWGRGDRPPTDTSDKGGETTYEHHSRIQEVPAMVQGFYRRAKKMRLPLDEIMTQDLDSEIEQGNLTPEEAKDLLRIWMLYAKRRLPKAIYTNQ